MTIMTPDIDIIFDLDGTLIDSAPSILGAFKQVVDAYSYAPKVPLNSQLIGPPLNQTLQYITGEDDAKKLSLLVDSFKENYDNDAYTLSTRYAGISGMLESLLLAKKRLHIATNKRLVPTQKIIRFFKWEQYFHTVYTIDGATPAYLNKSQMISLMLADLNLKPGHCVYVGDRLEDAQAASENMMRFIYVDWGYGPIVSEIENFQTVKTPDDLLTLLLAY